MTKKILVLLIFGSLVLSSCFLIPDVPARVHGSGNVTSETRDATGFTSISVEGSANVNVAFGTKESVTITAEDNIAPLIETNVQNHQLVIKTKPQMSYSTNRPVIIDVTMVSLDSVSIGGSGNIDVPELTADAFKAEITGSGNITVRGTANSVNLTVSGSGNLYCDQLKAKTAVATLTGSGNITIYASDSLEATLSGSGSIRYSGNPAKVKKNVTGSGTIEE
jgi:hypothetical protein